jgi:hypothetical protein
MDKLEVFENIDTIAYEEVEEFGYDKDWASDDMLDVEEFNEYIEYEAVEELGYCNDSACVATEADDAFPATFPYKDPVKLPFKLPTNDPEKLPVEIDSVKSEMEIL